MAKRKRYSAEQIIMNLREAEVLLGQISRGEPRISGTGGFAVHP